MTHIKRQKLLGPYFRAVNVNGGRQLTLTCNINACGFFIVFVQRRAAVHGGRHRHRRQLYVNVQY